MKEKNIDTERNYIVPVYIEKYSTPAGTFIYRQLKDVNIQYEKIILTSSKTEHLDKFPFKKIFIKKKNLVELLIIKFYEKVLRDRIAFWYHKILSPSQYFAFKQILVDDKIKFIHAHYGTGGLEIFPVIRSLNKKLLISFHGIDASSQLRSKAYVNHMRRIFKYASVIVPSEDMKRRLMEKVGNAKSFYVIHYGIPLEFFDRTYRIPISEKISKDKKIVFLQVSNFVEKKGHKYTVKAFAEVIKKFAKIELIIAGDGPTKNEIQELVDNLSLRTSVRIMGGVSQSEVKELMKNSDVFVHHSVTASNGDQEGIPNVIMEAMATGLPVISTYHSGIPELIEDGVNGFMVTERNVDDYIIKMMKILNQNSDTMPNSARATIEEKFNLEKQLIKLDQVYNNMINI